MGSNTRLLQKPVGEGMATRESDSIAEFAILGPAEDVAGQGLKV